MRYTFERSAVVLIFLILAKGGDTQDPSNNPKGCGNGQINLGSTSQLLIIPDNPQNQFTTETTCAYNITSEKNSIIVFRTNKITIGNDGDCTNDYLKVANTPEGINDTESVTCGTKLLAFDFESLSNTAFIVLKVKNNPQKCVVNGTLSTIKRVPSPACGLETLTLQSDSATLKIPAEGKQFIESAACIYHIQGNDDKKLSFEINSMNLGSRENCEIDFIRVADTPDKLYTSNYTFCGTTLPKDKYYSSTNKLSVYFATTTNPKKSFLTATYSKVNIGLNMKTSKIIIFLMLALVKWV